jgi:hypothetical protein
MGTWSYKPNGEVDGDAVREVGVIVNLALTLVLLWLIVRWVSRRGARPRLSTPTE